MNMKYLAHHGVPGQKHGIRKYQYEDGSLTPLGRIHYGRLQRKDVRWAHKKYNKIYKNVYDKSRREANDYVENDLNKRMYMYNTDGRISLQYVNEFNRKLAEIMTKNAADIQTPSGRAVKFIAKRGELGTHMIIADQEFNTQVLKNGVYASGKIAYKGEHVNMA